MSKHQHCPLPPLLTTSKKPDTTGEQKNEMIERSEVVDPNLSCHVVVRSLSSPMSSSVVVSMSLLLVHYTDRSNAHQDAVPYLSTETTTRLLLVNWNTTLAASPSDCQFGRNVFATNYQRIPQFRNSANVSSTTPPFRDTRYSAIIITRREILSRTPYSAFVATDNESLPGLLDWTELPEWLSRICNRVNLMNT